MELRDQFAMQALQAILANNQLLMKTNLDESVGRNQKFRVANTAYQYADAMMKARQDVTL